MVDHVDEMREVEFREEIHFYFEGLFLAGAREVDLEGVERVVFAAEVDIGLSSFSKEEVDGIFICVLFSLH